MLKKTSNFENKIPCFWPRVKYDAIDSLIWKLCININTLSFICGFLTYLGLCMHMNIPVNSIGSDNALFSGSNRQLHDPINPNILGRRNQDYVYERRGYKSTCISQIASEVISDSQIAVFCMTLWSEYFRWTRMCGKKKRKTNSCVKYNSNTLPPYYQWN